MFTVYVSSDGVFTVRAVGATTTGSDAFNVMCDDVVVSGWGDRLNSGQTRVHCYDYQS